MTLVLIENSAHDTNVTNNQLENDAQETNVTNTYTELKENSAYDTNLTNIQLEVKKIVHKTLK